MRGVAIRWQLDRLERLTRYETHLGRKFERTFAMLITLTELRGGARGYRNRGACNAAAS
jgi:hypothetical protein